jgi:hypothetical protein
VSKIYCSGRSTVLKSARALRYFRDTPSGAAIFNHAIILGMEIRQFLLPATTPVTSTGAAFGRAAELWEVAAAVAFLAATVVSRSARIVRRSILR